MKQLYAIFPLMMLAAAPAWAQSAICDSTANVIIYSNYDGGTLNIDIDKNISNLKIGVTSYEAVNIVITGAYVGNVTEVRYAGYNAGNNHCSPTVATTSISGVASNLDTIIIYPPAGYTNANGWPNILCNYSCDNTTNQGGCNTPDQIVYYFTNAFSGTLNYHHTQYNCWSASTTYSVSAGGNCCIMPTTGISQKAERDISVFPNPAADKLHVSFSNRSAHQLALVNLLGEEVLTLSTPAGAAKTILDVAELMPGAYVLRVSENGRTSYRKITVQ